MSNRKYIAPDKEKFNRKLPARQYVVDLEDVSHKMAEDMIEEVGETEDDEEMLEVFTFRVTEHLAAERSVKVKATCEDEAEERAERAMLSQKPKVTHTVHEEMHKLNKVDEVSKSKIENGDYYEEFTK